MIIQEFEMSHAPQHDQHAGEVDSVEAIIHVVPWLIPLAGAVLIFLLAFIAVFMA
jgi:hypothetical protein